MGRVMAYRSHSRRERLKRERQERILEAAATLFASKGFHQATIREIAQLADVADGTIYNYFANKRDLLVALTRHVIADSAGVALAQYNAEDDRGFLTSVLNERFGFAESHAEFIRATMIEVWTNEEFRQQYLEEVIEPLLQLLGTYLESRIEAGTVRPLKTGIVVRAMVGSVLIFLMLAQSAQSRPWDGVSREELVSELVDFFLLGLAAPRQQGEGEKA